MMGSKGTCETYAHLVNDYADGRLEGRKLEALEMHMASCAACRQSLEETRRLRQLISQSAVPEGSSAFWERCMAAVAAAGRPRGIQLRRLWKPALGLAFAAAAAALLLWLQPVALPPIPTVGRRQTARAEVPESEYIMQHAAFAASQPLGAASHHLLISAWAQDEEGE